MQDLKRTPNLICIGVEKSGTTFLNAVFENSESILTPNKKELFYYNLNFDEGLDWYQSWYDFSKKPDAPYVCDVTPSYFRSKKAIARIAETAPGAKLIVLVRHPVYRAFSHYIHRLRHVALKLESYSFSFREVMAGANGKNDIFPLYFQKFEPWLERFGQKNMLVLSYEKDLFDPELVESKLGRFLSVNDLDFGKFRTNRINDGKMPGFYYGGEAGEELSLAGKDFFIPAHTLVLSHAKGDKVWQHVDPELALANIEAAKNWTPGLNPSEVRQVYEEYFEQDCRKFCDTFGLDVGEWETTEPVSYAPALPGEQFLV